MPKIQKKNKIEQCTKIFIYRDLKVTLITNVFFSYLQAHKRPIDVQKLKFLDFFGHGQQADDFY